MNIIDVNYFPRVIWVRGIVKCTLFKLAAELVKPDRRTGREGSEFSRNSHPRHWGIRPKTHVLRRRDGLVGDENSRARSCYPQFEHAIRVGILGALDAPFR